MCVINGSVREYRQIEVADAQFLYEIYGDETVCDADKKMATQFVHLDTSPDAFQKCNS